MVKRFQLGLIRLLKYMFFPKDEVDGRVNMKVKSCEYA
jgi:hypothetical protein